MDMLTGVIDMITGIVGRIFDYIDMIMNNLNEGRNKYMIYAIFLYLIGVFGTAKLRLNIKTGGKK